MPVFSSLSTAERAVLLLLAEGHTAKTAAAALGLTTNAVNERLRDARRKTGVGSSRELARLMQAEDKGGQESCPEKIGLPVASPDGHTAGENPGAHRPGNRLRGVAGMTTLAAAVGAATAILVSGALAARPGPAPRVISTYPVQGAKVQPGPLTLVVTFDRPMQAGSYSFVTHDPATYPDCAKTPVQSADGRSFKLTCVLKPRHLYEVGFNDETYRHFTSAADGVAAKPARLTFSTP